MARVSKKKQQIVETAEGLFVRHGIRRVSVEEICQRAHVSKMTFYKYFANKLTLVQYIWDRWIDTAHITIEEVDAMPIPFPEKLWILQDYKLQMTARMSREFIEELLQTEFYRLSAASWRQRVMKFLIDSQARGDIRPEVRPEFLMAVINKLNELVEDDYLKGLYADYTEFTREIWDFFYYGIIDRETVVKQ